MLRSFTWYKWSQQQIVSKEKNFMSASCPPIGLHDIIIFWSSSHFYDTVSILENFTSTHNLTSTTGGYFIFLMKNYKESTYNSVKWSWYWTMMQNYPSYSWRDLVNGYNCAAPGYLPVHTETEYSLWDSVSRPINSVHQSFIVFPGIFSSENIYHGANCSAGTDMH